MTAPGSRINQRFDRELTIYPILFPFSSSNCFVDSPPILNEMELQGGNGDNQEIFNYPPNEIYNLDPKRILNVEKWEKKKSLTQYVLNAQLHNYRYYILTFVFKRIYSHDCFSSSRSLLSSCSFGETFFPQSIGASSLPILQHAALLPQSPCHARANLYTILCTCHKNFHQLFIFQFKQRGCIGNSSKGILKFKLKYLPNIFTMITIIGLIRFVS